MTNDVQLHREGDQVTISIGGSISTMNIGEWSKLISRPKRYNVFAFAQTGEPPPIFDHLPSDSEPA